MVSHVFGLVYIFNFSWVHKFRTLVIKRNSKFEIDGDERLFEEIMKESGFDMNVVRGKPRDRNLRNNFQIGSGIS